MFVLYVNAFLFFFFYTYSVKYNLLLALMFMVKKWKRLFQRKIKKMRGRTIRVEDMKKYILQGVENNKTSQNTIVNSAVKSNFRFSHTRVAIVRLWWHIFIYFIIIISAAPYDYWQCPPNNDNNVVIGTEGRIGWKNKKNRKRC